MIKRRLWKIFGNDEDWPPEQWYYDRHSGKPDWVVKGMWLLRNPLHNLTWHVIGVHGKVWSRVGIDPSHSYARAGGWQWCVIKYKYWRLPYISYINRRFRFRIGWGDAGNFTPLSIRRTRKDIITW
jgi:hypothetical protein